MLIGRGSYGEVIADDKNSVTKTYYNEDTFIRELFYLSYFKGCSHICQIKSYNFESKTITMQRYQTDLLHLSMILTYEERIRIMDTIIDQILISLQHLHSIGIIHGDLFVQNVFCNYDEGKIECFLGDFSLSCIRGFDRADYLITLIPEKNNLNTKYDIWCLGLLIQNFLFREIEPFRSHFEDSKKTIFNPLEITENYKCTEKTFNYIQNFLVVNREERFGFPIKTSFSACDMYLRLFKALYDKRISGLITDCSYFCINNINFKNWDPFCLLDQENLIDKINSIRFHEIHDNLDVIFISDIDKNIYSTKDGLVKKKSFTPLDKIDIICKVPERYDLESINSMLHQQLNYMRCLFKKEERLYLTIKMHNFIYNTEPMHILSTKKVFKNIKERFTLFMDDDNFIKGLGQEAYQFFRNKYHS